MVKVAAPCRQKWSKLKGDAQVRFCTLCGLNVYNLSKLSSDDARALIRENEGQRLCVRFYARKDGTVLTVDCPRGVVTRTRWRNVRTVGAVVLALKLLLVGLITLFGDNVRRLFGDSTTGALAGAPWVAPRSVPADAPEWLEQTPYPTFQLEGQQYGRLRLRSPASPPQRKRAREERERYWR